MTMSRYCFLTSSVRGFSPSMYGCSKNLPLQTSFVVMACADIIGQQLPVTQQNCQLAISRGALPDSFTPPTLRPAAPSGP
jgi:hypothetical protein